MPQCHQKRIRIEGAVCCVLTDWGSVSSRAECAGVADAQAAQLQPLCERGASGALPAAAEGPCAHAAARRHPPTKQEAGN